MRAGVTRCDPKRSADPETRRRAAQFAAEEASHGAQLVAMLGKLPPDAEYGLEEDDEPNTPE